MLLYTNRRSIWVAKKGDDRVVEVIVCHLKDVKWLILGAKILVDINHCDELYQRYKNITKDFTSLYFQ